jgi:hypothetical protein
VEKMLGGIEITFRRQQEIDGVPILVALASKDRR